MIARAGAAMLALALAAPALALESAQWPPPEPVEARMRSLQQVIVARDSSPAQRDAARNELASLLKSPAGRERLTPREEIRKPARAAIDPLPSVVRPRDPAPPPPPPPGVATLEVVPPPRVSVDPRTGASPAPSGRFAVDPRTGAVLHETPGGYVDPQTGRFVPR